MKRLIAAGILLTFVIVAYFSGYFYINKTINEAEKLLKECVTVYEESQKAKNEAKKLNKFWSDKEQSLSIFVNHADIDEIESAISCLLVYSDTEQNEIFLEYSGTVKTLLHQIIEDTRPSAHSIL